MLPMGYAGQQHHSAELCSGWPGQWLSPTVVGGTRVFSAGDGGAAKVRSKRPNRRRGKSALGPILASIRQAKVETVAMAAMAARAIGGSGQQAEAAESAAWPAAQQQIAAYWLNAAQADLMKGGIASGDGSGGKGGDGGNISGDVVDGRPGRKGGVGANVGVGHCRRRRKW